MNVRSPLPSWLPGARGRTLALVAGVGILCLTSVPRFLLASTSFEKSAVAISGVGYFASMPGVLGRQLGVFRLDTLAGCKVRRL